MTYTHAYRSTRRDFATATVAGIIGHLATCSTEMIVCDTFSKTCNHRDSVFCHAGEQSRMRKAEHRSSEEEVVECSRRPGLRKRFSFLVSLSTSDSTSLLIRFSLYLFTVRAVARYNLEGNEQEGALE